jgi:hypothetical protein
MIENLLIANRYQKGSLDWILAYYHNYGKGYDPVNKTFDGLDEQTCLEHQDLLHENGWDKSIQHMNQTLSFLVLRERYWIRPGLEELNQYSPICAIYLSEYVKRFGDGVIRAILGDAFMQLATLYGVADPAMSNVVKKAKQKETDDWQKKLLCLLGLGVISQFKALNDVEEIILAMGNINYHSRKIDHQMA